MAVEGTDEAVAAQEVTRISCAFTSSLLLFSRSRRPTTIVPQRAPAYAHRGRMRQSGWHRVAHLQNEIAPKASISKRKSYNTQHGNVPERVLSLLWLSKMFSIAAATGPAEPVTCPLMPNFFFGVGGPVLFGSL